MLSWLHEVHTWQRDLITQTQTCQWALVDFLFLSICLSPSHSLTHTHTLTLTAHPCSTHRHCSSTVPVIDNRLLSVWTRCHHVLDDGSAPTQTVPQCHGDALPILKQNLMDELGSWVCVCTLRDFFLIFMIVYAHTHIHTSTCKYTQSIWYHWLVSSGLAPVRAWRVWAVIRHPAVFLCQQGLLSAWLSASQDNVTHTYTHLHTQTQTCEQQREELVLQMGEELLKLCSIIHLMCQWSTRAGVLISLFEEWRKHHKWKASICAYGLFQSPQKRCNLKISQTWQCVCGSI